MTDGGLEELHHAQGGPYGGTSVNRKFERTISDLIGEKVVNEVQEHHSADWFEFISEFERKKCYHANTKAENETKVIMRIPPIFNSILQSTKGVSLEETIQSSNYSDKIKAVRDKLHISRELFSSLFEVSLMGILGNVETVLNCEKLSDCEIILMVGGYAQCHILQEAMRLQFNDYRVVVTEDPQYAVLKGAVMFGFRPRTLCSRVCQYTYGIAKQVPFNPDIHPAEKCRRIGRREFCDDIFDIHVQKGELMEVDVFQPEKEYLPARRDQVFACLELYASTEKEPKFITDDSCEFIGIMQLELTNTDSRYKDLVLVRMNFSGTNVEIEAQEKESGRLTVAKCNFLG